MKKILFCLLILAGTHTGFAQENIPVFEDPTPNLPNIGRSAEPLDKLVLTPNPLPSIEVNLSKNKKQDTKAIEPVKEIKETQETQTKDITSQNFERTTPVSFKKGSGIMQLKRISQETESNNEKSEASNTSSETHEVSQNVSSSIHHTTTTSTISQKNTSNTGFAASTPMLQSAEAIENLFGKTHNVHDFELSGLMLGMYPEDVIDVMREMGFKRTQIKYSIPMFRSAFYEQNCRDRRVYPLNEMRLCIERQADRDDVKYISSMTFKKASTKEYIRVLFSSYATDNQAFKIYYESEGDNSLTMTQRNLAKQLRRKDMFWRMMFETYGLPDDSELIVWGDPDKAYMQAVMTGSSYNAYIVLEDKEIQDTDYFAAEDEKDSLEYRQQFTFAPYGE
ncbi:MAG: hypothetical protein IKV03_00550 [Alphaproteobacteria bacterium]|nr:hypothetical protein [Alphaproteobacteria bacterium]